MINKSASMFSMSVFFKLILSFFHVVRTLTNTFYENYIATYKISWF